MFRALLWKEWRELWVLPVAAALLAAMSFFVTNAATQEQATLWWDIRPAMTAPLSSVVWDLAFSMWLFLAAVYIPTHLYTREKELRTADFVGSKPLDRFRLWWLRVLVGVVTLAVIGVILFVVTAGLSLPYEKASDFFRHRADVVPYSILMALFLFALSSFFSSLFKRQISAILCAVLAIPLFFLVFLVGLAIPGHAYLSSMFRIVVRGDPSSEVVRTFILTPALLYGSLLAFTRRSLWRQTKQALFLGYGAAAALALVPMTMGISDIFPDLRLTKATDVSDWKIRVLDISKDGNRFLLLTQPGNTLTAIDVSRRRATILDAGEIHSGGLVGNDDTLIYGKYKKYPVIHLYSDSTLILSNFEGTKKTEIFGSDRWSRSILTPWVRESLDGTYLGLAKGVNERLRQDGYVIIADYKGEVLGQYLFPVLEGGAVVPWGWDYRSRFYFRKHDVHGLTYWTVTPDKVVPERVTFLPERASFSRNISPDGRWIPYDLPTGKIRRGRDRWEKWLYDLTDGTSHMVSDKAEHLHWSEDGSLVAFVEAETEDSWGGEELEEPLIRISLVIYAPQTRERFSVLMEPNPNWRIYSWSPSNRYVLTSTKDRYRGTTLRVFLTEAKQFVPVEPLFNEASSIVWNNTRRGQHMRWLPGDRLLWVGRDSLITTEYDGSDPQEILCVENGRFYFDGEGKS